MFISQYDTNEDEQIDNSEAMEVFKDITDKKNITGVNPKMKLVKEKRLPFKNIKEQLDISVLEQMMGK